MLAFIQKFRESLYSLKTSNKLGVIIALFLLLSLPLIVIVAQQQQETRQRASEEPVTPPFPPVTGFGKAARLSGIGNYIKINNLPTQILNLDVTKDFTIETFIKVNSYKTTPFSYTPIFARASGKSESRNFAFEISSKENPTLAFDIERPYYPDLSLAVISNTKIVENTWYHVAIIRDKDFFKLFINGVLEKQEHILPSFPIVNHGDIYAIGADWGSNSVEPDYFGDIDIDELRISKVARYSTNFNLPSTSPFTSDSNTLALYHFDENVNDTSGNGNNGQLVGDVQFIDSSIGITATLTPTPSSSTVKIRTWGDSYNGNPRIMLSDGNGILQQYTVTATSRTSAQIFTYVFPQGRTFKDKPKVSFLNDYSQGLGRDRNVYIDYIEINGVKYESEDPKTYSIGSYTNNNGCRPGYKQQEVLACNGYFRYDGYGVVSNPSVVQPTNTPIPTLTTSFICTICIADINKDNYVNGLDFSLLSSCINKTAAGSCKVADINGDGKVDNSDFQCLKSQYGKICQTTPAPTFTPAPPSSKKIFVTYAGTGNLGGLAGADVKCQQKANTAGLDGVFKAWLSSSTVSASSRLYPSSQPYKLVNGVEVASNWGDLTDGTLKNPINLNEKGHTVNSTVWTGTNSNGASYSLNGNTPEYFCFDWTRDYGGGNIGQSSFKDKYWTSKQGDFCGTARYLYCFEQ